MSPNIEVSGSEEERLIAAVLRKDRKATGEFVARYADAVYSYIRHRLIPRSDLVEDLVQDVFLAAWTSLPKFRGQSSLQSWLLGIARHKVEDYYRARLREAMAEPESVASEPVGELRLDEFLDQERRQQKVRRILQALPEAHGLILLWRYWEQRSAREMAEQIGRTEKAIERLLARAREQFKRRWNDD